MDAGYSRIWQAGTVCSWVRKYIVGMHGENERAVTVTDEDLDQVSDVEVERIVAVNPTLPMRRERRYGERGREGGRERGREGEREREQGVEKAMSNPSSYLRYLTIHVGTYAYGGTVSHSPRRGTL